jgi:hypothetical protein
MSLPTKIDGVDRKFRFAVEWKPQDLWVGAFWKRHRYPSGRTETHLWVCLLPMIPLHFHWWSRRGREDTP